MIKGNNTPTDRLAWAEDVVAGFQHLHNGYMAGYLADRLRGYLSLNNDREEIDILGDAIVRVDNKLKQWNPSHPALIEVKDTLRNELPGIIRGDIF